MQDFGFELLYAGICILNKGIKFNFHCLIVADHRFNSACLAFIGNFQGRHLLVAVAGKGLIQGVEIVLFAEILHELQMGVVVGMLGRKINQGGKGAQNQRVVLRQSDSSHV